MDSERESSELSSVDDRNIVLSGFDTSSIVSPKGRMSPPSPSVKFISKRHQSMQILRTPKIKPRRKSSTISVASRPDRAQDILDNVLLRISTLRENPDMLLSESLIDLTSDVDGYNEMKDN